VFANCAPKRSPRSTGSSAWTCPSSPSTGRFTRLPTVVKAPVPTPLPGPNTAGSGPSASTVTASRSAGHRRSEPQRRPPPGTDHRYHRHQRLAQRIDTLHLDRGYDYPKIRHQLCAAGLDDHVIQRRPSTRRHATQDDHARAPLDHRSHQQPGCRTTANSAATPTARAATATPHSASPPPCSSSANSSPGETAGTHDDIASPLKT
jgi:hypothetical protein